MATAVLGWPSTSYPYGIDQAIFGVIGDIWLHGGLPYRDAWDVKPPFVFGTYAIAEAMLGYAQSSIRYFDLVAVATTAWILSLMAGKMGRAACLVAALTYPFIYFLGFGFWDTAQAESFALPFSTAALFLILERRSQFLIGLFVGIAAMFKPTFYLLLLPNLIFVRPRLRDIFALGFGLASPVAATVYYFAARGEIRLLFNQVELILAYSSPLPPGGWKFTLSNVLRETAVIHLAAFVGIISLLSWRLRLVQLTWAWWIASFLMMIIQGRYFAYHALPMAPPAALLFALAIGQSSPDPRQMKAMLAGIGALAILTLYIRLPYFTDTRYVYRSFRFDSDENARVVEAISSVPGSTMWVDAYEPYLYFLVRRFPPTRHLSTAPISDERQIPIYIRERFATELSQELKASPPDVYVGVMNRDDLQVQRFGQSYGFVQKVGRHRIFRRLGPS